MCQARCEAPTFRASLGGRHFTSRLMLIHAPVFIEHILGAGTVLGSGGSEVKKTNRRPQAGKRPWAGLGLKGGKAPGAPSVQIQRWAAPLGGPGPCVDGRGKVEQPRSGQAGVEAEPGSMFRGCLALGCLPMRSHKETPEAQTDAFTVLPPCVEALT